MKAWQKIDKFFPILFVVVLALAVIVVFTFRSIFSAVNTAQETDEGGLEDQLRIDKHKIDDATKAVFEREIIPLEITE